MEMADNRWAKRLMWVVWPAFLVAGVLEMLVFAMVDPQDLHWAGQPLELSRQGIYTVAFFVFWGLTLLGCSLTALLAMSPQEVNEPGAQDRD
ncbi:hypothetical protein O4H66_12130 [Comamonadaceae bacterium G21597-S1]|nr:hypothetical protein [Comamonadaceae bacterium G21597-S1]